MLFEQIFADDFLFELVHGITHVGRPVRIDRDDMLGGLGLELADFLVADRLVIGQDGHAHAAIGEFLDCSEDFFRQVRGDIAELGLADFGDNAFDEAAELLDDLVTFDDRIEHDIVRHFIGAGFDHADFFFRTSERDMHLALGALLFRGIDDDLAIDQADMDAGDRAIPRDVRDRDGNRGAEHGGDFRGIVLVDRHDHIADGAVIAQVFREERADRTVNDARGQDGLLGRTAFALDEAAGEFADAVHFFFIVDAEREKVDAGAGGG